MREYLISLIAVALITSVCLALSHGVLRSSVKGALGLLMLASVIPSVLGLTELLGQLELDSPDGAYPEGSAGYLEVAEGAFADGIEKDISDKYGVEVEGIYVRCDGFDFATMRAERIYVTLSGSAAVIDNRAVGEYVCKNYTDGGRCDVEIDPW